ncbi:FAD-dependent oxidoreductase, partial [Pyxidicoccus sp. 3LG]
MRHSDVIIVGGGIMGCGIALRLRQGSARVTVLERSIPGAEAPARPPASSPTDGVGRAGARSWSCACAAGGSTPPS